MYDKGPFEWDIHHVLIDIGFYETDRGTYVNLDDEYVFIQDDEDGRSILMKDFELQSIMPFDRAINLVLLNWNGIKNPLKDNEYIFIDAEPNDDLNSDYDMDEHHKMDFIYKEKDKKKIKELKFFDPLAKVLFKADEAQSRNPSPAPLLKYQWYWKYN